MTLRRRGRKIKSDFKRTTYIKVRCSSELKLLLSRIREKTEKDKLSDADIIELAVIQYGLDFDLKYTSLKE